MPEESFHLFDESEFQPKSRADSGDLTICPQPGHQLSKQQRSFNTLVRRIAELERMIETERLKLDRLLHRHGEEVGPKEQALARGRIELARALAGSCGRFAFGKRQMGIVREMIVDLCHEAFAAVEPDADIERFYDEWAETSFREEAERNEEHLKETIAENLRDMFGFDPFEEDPPCEEATGFRNGAEDPGRGAETEHDGKPRNRRSTRREKQREKANQREALTKASVRTIYLSLAKVLHPDTVTDVAERSLREEFMKQAAAAYRQGDIATLLRLELRWATRPDASGQAASDEALRAYIPALKEQVQRLEHTLGAQALDPRYLPIAPVARLTEGRALVEMTRRAQALKMALTEIEQRVKFVEQCRSRPSLVEMARDYLDAREVEWDFDDMLADLLMH
jgi:hypothetical protein